MPKKTDCVMQCANCAFYRGIEADEAGEEYGRCHRNPPVMVPEGEMYSFDFPTVNETDFCGEFARADN